MRRALGGLTTLACVVALLGCPPDRPRGGDVRRVSPLPPALVAGLGSPYATKRIEAAFSLGQLGVAWDPVPVEVQLAAADRLVAQLAVERDDEARVEIVAALGRVGRDGGRTALLSELDRPGPARLRAGWALCHLYRRLDKELDPTRDLKAIERALVAPEPEVRAALACALAEVKRPSARPLVRPLLTDGDARVRAFAASALARTGDPDDVVVLRHLLDDADERAAANAALALGQLAERGQAPSLVADVLGKALPQLERPAVTLTLANARLLAPALETIFAQLAERQAHDNHPRLACLAALAHDRIVGRVQLVATCGGDATPAVERARLVGRVYAECEPKRDPASLAQLLALSPPEDREARVEYATALGRFDDPRTRARLRTLLDDREPTVWATAAESATLLHATELGPALLPHLPRAATGQRVVVGATDIEPLLSLLAAVAELRPPGAAPLVAALTTDTPAAIATAARDAYARLEPSAPKLRAQPALVHGPFDELGLPDGPVVVRLETSRGVMRLDVRHDRAPRTARNFIGLVRRGFYDGLTFHRIVPGFVAQGGDPRGDGTGGADHVIACEPNPLRYVEGTVGMALSGHDTGSSQFFIALAPVPRLEGRYTPFAQVVDGMSVARALEPGDKILRATIEASTP